MISLEFRCSFNHRFFSLDLSTYVQLDHNRAQFYATVLWFHPVTGSYEPLAGHHPFNPFAFGRLCFRKQGHFFPKHLWPNGIWSDCISGKTLHARMCVSKQPIWHLVSIQYAERDSYFMGLLAGADSFWQNAGVKNSKREREDAGFSNFRETKKMKSRGVVISHLKSYCSPIYTY